MTDPAARPLAGRRVLVTRARAQATGLAALLTERGAKPVVLPLIAPVSLTDTREAETCVERLASGAYQWLIFSSGNGVRYFLQRLHALGYGASICRRARIVAGPATVQLLVEQGIEADLVLKRFRAETVLAALATEPLSGTRVMLPRAAGGRELLAAGLRQRGARVDDVALYRTVPVPESAAVLAGWLGRGALDALTFTSGLHCSPFRRRPSGHYSPGLGARRYADCVSGTSDGPHRVRPRPQGGCGRRPDDDGGARGCPGSGVYPSLARAGSIGIGAWAGCCDDEDLMGPRVNGRRNGQHRTGPGWWSRG